MFKRILISILTAFSVFALMLGWQAFQYSRDLSLEASLLHLPDGTVEAQDVFSAQDLTIQAVSNDAYTLLMNRDGEIVTMDVPSDMFEDSLSEFSFY